MSFPSFAVCDHRIRRSRPTLSVWALALTLAAILIHSLFVPVPAQAQEPEEDENVSTSLSDETPTKIGDKIVEDGVYIAESRTAIERAPLVQAVTDAADDGIKLIIVVPEDPAPDAESFARRMQEATGVDAVVVVPPDDGPVASYAPRDFESSRIRAGSRAKEVGDPAEAAAVFVQELQSDGTGSVPILVLLLVAVILVLLYIAYGSTALEAKVRAKKAASLEGTAERA